MMTQLRSGDRILPLLTCAEVRERKLTGHRYFVELISKQTEIQDDRAVPVSTQVIDVVVTQPTINAISQLVATCEWLKGYSIVSYNELSFDEAPF